ncbi:MAG: EAL domain-containing protein [Proteobacteria bacterium]|nr:EAL domain-containing protein [Pseudomonadota bacterium]
MKTAGEDANHTRFPQRPRAVLLAGLWLSLLLPLLFTVMLWFDYQHERELADERAMVAAQAVQRQLGERLELLVHQMQDLAGQARAKSSCNCPTPMLASLPSGSILQDVVLIQSNPGNGKGVDLLDRPADASWLPPESSDAQPQGLAIGVPTRTADAGRWVVPVAWYGDRQWRVGARVDADWFAQALVDFPLGDNSTVSLVHVEGMLLAHSRDNQNSIGASLDQAVLFSSRYRDQASGSFDEAGMLDREPRQFVFQRVAHTPLIVVVGTASRTIFAAWWPLPLVSFSGALLFAALWWSLNRAFARTHAAQERLVDDLRWQSTRLEEARRIAHLGDWSWNVDTGEVLWSPEIYEICGLPPRSEPMHIDSVPALIHPDDRERVVGYLTRARTGGVVNETHYRIIRSNDGAVRTVYARAEWADRSPGHRVLRGIQQDITELAQARERLGEAERQYRYLFEHNPLPMWVYDRQSLTFIAVNDAMLAAYGYTREELLGASTLDIRPPEDREALRAVANDEPSARPQGSVWTHLRRDGNRLLAEVHAQRIDFEGRDAWLVLALDVTAREHNQQRFQLIAGATSDAIWDYDGITGETWRSDSFHSLFGYTRGEVPADQQGWIDRVHPDDREAAAASVTKSLIDGSTLWEQRYRFLRKDGSYADVLDRGTLLHDASGKVVRALGGMLDVTQRNRDEQDLRLLRRAVESADNGIVIADARQPDLPLVYVNHAFERMTGYSEAELLGRACPCLDPAWVDNQHEIMMLRRAIEERREARVLLRDRRKDGQAFWNDVYVAPVRDDAGAVTHLISIQSDVSERQRAQEQIAFNATHDELTGLPNRHLLVDRLQQAVLNAERHQRSVAVLFIDLDDFKLINDSLGHTAGDAALREVAHRLVQAVADADTVARFGGDEFVVLLDERTDDASVGQAIARINQALAQPFTISGISHYVASSIGWCRSPDAGSDAETLLMRADMAMYKAKQAGRNRAVAYERSFDHQVSARLRLVNELRQALEHGQFELHFQPLFNRDGTPVALEALVRWRHPERGLLLPGHFIGVCEESGLVVPLGRWVLGEAMRHHSALAAAGFNALRIAVNISSLHFQQGLFADVDAALREHRVPRGVLELELTESVIMGNPDSAIEVMRRLDGLGVALSVDDFGTGYSSLSYLKRLPIDRLKIDRSFVSDLGVDADDAAICTSIIRMAHSLGLSTVAEGVETAAQLDWLRERGCDEMQGFLLGHPLPFDAVLAQLLQAQIRPA